MSERTFSTFYALAFGRARSTILAFSLSFFFAKRMLLLLCFLIALLRNQLVLLLLLEDVIDHGLQHLVASWLLFQNSVLLI